MWREWKSGEIKKILIFFHIFWFEGAGASTHNEWFPCGKYASA